MRGALLSIDQQRLMAVADAIRIRSPAQTERGKTCGSGKHLDVTTVLNLVSVGPKHGPPGCQHVVHFSCSVLTGDYVRARILGFIAEASVNKHAGREHVMRDDVYSLSEIVRHVARRGKAARVNRGNAAVRQNLEEGDRS